MDERKILLFVLALIAYFMYSVNVWYTKQNVKTEITIKEENTPSAVETETEEKVVETQEIKIIKEAIPLFIKDACSILEAFTEKPPVIKSRRKLTKEELSTDNNAITVIGITVFLLILLIHAILEAIKAREEEKAKRKLNPNGERRQSLAEFANKKPLRRESSRFSFQLFQIAESFVHKEDEKKTITRRQIRPYKRGASINSYLSETHRKPQEGSAPASISENSTGDPRLIKRQSVAKLFGARPAPMVRRSSFPVLPLNPDIQALMLGHRQQSFDSDDEGDGRGRRVRIIRRY